MNMFRKSIRFALILLSLASGCSRSDRSQIIIETFDAATYGEWTREGTAFAAGPSGREDTHHMVGFLGKGFASSVNPGNEPAVGTLTSPPFIIERNTIHFLIGAHEIHFLPGTAANPEDLVVQLLIDDRVARSTIPDEFHAMFWRAWDVSDLKGRTARIRIVDNDGREWAHIDIDHIVMNDIPAGGFLSERTVTVTQPVLNFPVNEKFSRYYVELRADGKQIRGMDVALAPGEIDYWVVTDISPWQGKDVQIRTRQYGVYDPSILDRITTADDILGSEDLYNEPLRPQFHFSSRRGWINDPNGLVYYDGEYHLFYQHNPFGWDHSRNDYNKTWGHAVSDDLVHWKELPGAIHPNHLGPIYSGSAVVDHHNTTGFQTEDEKPIVCIYTSAGGRSPWSKGRKFTQSIAYSNDRGRTFTIYEGNPVQENLDYINRDPKAIWYEPADRWVIVLHFDERAMVFFTSDNLKKWEKQSEFESPYLVDCPELFELAVDGDEKNTKWVIYGGSGAYYIGDFNGKAFIPETGIIEYNRGNCFYASQTFSNAPQGRRIQMAWALTPAWGMPFNMSILFPVELTLRSTEDGIRLFALPVKEIGNICSKEYTWSDLKIEPGQKRLSGIEGELFDIDAEFTVGESNEFGFIIHGMPVTYNRDENLLSCGGEEVILKPVDGRIKLRILVDRLSVEIYANDGRVYMPVRAYPEEKDRGLTVFTKGGDTLIRSLTVHELESIWN
jgi:sucrose-6-phosphate hydrolase SacC (GH32 family)